MRSSYVAPRTLLALGLFWCGVKMLKMLEPEVGGTSKDQGRSAVGKGDHELGKIPNHEKVFKDLESVEVIDSLSDKRERREFENHPRIECKKSLFDYEMDDPCMIQRIQRWLHGKTFPAEGPQFNRNPVKLRGQYGQPQFIDEMLDGMEGGFFIECGAHDGEEFSNTLLFELERNWTGILIEPNHPTFQNLILKNRNAYSINTCLSGGHKAQELRFASNRIASKSELLPLQNDAAETKNDAQKGTRVICVPLYSILLALGNPTVDFFSLDIEGAEIPVLETMPWKQVKIKLIMVEVGNPIHEPKTGEMHRILTANGYCLYDKTKIDLVYAHSKLTNFCGHTKIRYPEDFKEVERRALRTFN